MRALNIGVRLEDTENEQIIRADQALQQGHYLFFCHGIYEAIVTGAPWTSSLHQIHKILELLKRWMKSRGTHKGRGLVGYRPV